MKVQDVMTAAPCCCRADEPLSAAARIMWQDDCGCVPVVDHDGRLVGIVTDRDACMAAYTRGRRFDDISVGSVMAEQPICCAPDDDLGVAEQRMRDKQVRRLPVVGAGGKLVGVLSCNDLIRRVADIADLTQRANASVFLVQVLAAIGSPRPESLPTAAGRASDVIPSLAPAVARPAPQPAVAAASSASAAAANDAAAAKAGNKGAKPKPKGR